ncbi:uncharacterized protein LOC127280783 [Leptopilina boulardi]|uniref:uncharacterized protein LOC127280783 n=1 Tax=Leptopilina boulardi TaxID=63433 RepID=UPI0021F681FA|nr:uncharacterized protein LOC127280783 [Leptopilina boulardi]
MARVERGWRRLNVMREYKYLNILSEELTVKVIHHQRMSRKTSIYLKFSPRNLRRIIQQQRQPTKSGCNYFRNDLHFIQRNVASGITNVRVARIARSRVEHYFHACHKTVTTLLKQSSLWVLRS